MGSGHLYRRQQISWGTELMYSHTMCKKAWHCLLESPESSARMVVVGVSVCGEGSADGPQLGSQTA